MLWLSLTQGAIMDLPAVENLQLDEDDDLDGLFQYATEHVKTIIGTLSSEDLLFFYGRYKQSTIGPCNTDRPSFFDFTGKQKWDAWKNVGDISEERAKDDYIQKLCLADPGWLNKISTNQQSKNQGWASVSSMVNDEKGLKEDEKKLVDWIKEDNVAKVRELSFKWNASDVDSVINYRDENGMGVIHWAADRGNKDIVKMLLDIKDLDVNQKDNDGQTALHYASSCGHLEVVQLLIDCPKVDRTIRDNDNLVPEDTAVDNEVKNILRILP